MPRTTNNSSIKQVWENNPDTPLIASTLSKSLDYSVSYKNFNTEYSPDIEGRDRILAVDPNDQTQILLKRSTVFQIINEATDDQGNPVIPANEQYKLFDVGLDDIIITINDTDETQPSKINWLDGHWFVYICDKRDSSFYGKSTPDAYGGGAQIIASKQNTHPSNVQVPGFPEYNYTEKDTRIIGGFQTVGGNIIANSIWDIAGKFDTVKVKNGYYILDENVNPMAYSLRRIDFRDLNTNRNNVVEGSLTVQGVSNLNSNANITGNVSISSNNFKIDSDNGHLYVADDGTDSSLETTFPITFNANTTFNQPITFSTNVSHTGNYNITGDLTQDGNLSVEGKTTLDGELSQVGKVTLGKSGSTITSAGSWSHNGSFQFDGNLVVNEKATFNGDFFIKSNVIKFEDEQEDISFEIDALNNKFVYNSKLEVQGDILFQNGSVAINADDNFYTTVPSDKVFRHSGGQFIVDNADFIVRKDIDSQLLNIDTSESLLTLTSNITSVINDTQIIEILNSKENDNNIITIQGNPNIIRVDGNLQLRNGSVDANVTGDLTGNADTATQFETAPTLKLVTSDTSKTDSFEVTQDIIGNQETLEVNIDHTHDGRYYTETETSDRFLRTHKDDDLTAPAAQVALGDITFSGTITAQNSIVGNSDTATKFENTLTLDINSTEASDTDASLRMTDVFQNLVQVNGDEGTIDVNIDHTHDDRYYNKFDLNPNQTGDGVATLVENVDFSTQTELDIRYYTRQDIDNNIWTRTQLGSGGDGNVSWDVVSGIPYDETDIGAFKDSIPRLDHAHRLNISGLNNPGEEFPLRDFVAGWDVRNSLMDIRFSGLSSIFSLEGIELSDEEIVSDILADEDFILYYNDGSTYSGVRFWFNSINRGMDNPPTWDMPSSRTAQETELSILSNTNDQLEGKYFDLYDQVTPHRFWINVEGAPDNGTDKVDISSEMSLSTVLNRISSKIDSISVFNSATLNSNQIEFSNVDPGPTTPPSFETPDGRDPIISDIETVVGTTNPTKSVYSLVFTGTNDIDYVGQYIKVYDGPNPVHIEFVDDTSSSLGLENSIEVEVESGDGFDIITDKFIDAVNNSSNIFGFDAVEDGSEVILTSKHEGISPSPTPASPLSVTQTEEGTAEAATTTIDFSDSTLLNYHENYIIIFKTNQVDSNYVIYQFVDTSQDFTSNPALDVTGVEGATYHDIEYDSTGSITIDDLIILFTNTLESESSSKFTYDRSGNIVTLTNRTGGIVEQTQSSFTGSVTFSNGTDGARQQSSIITFRSDQTNSNRDYEASTLSLHSASNDFVLYFHLTDGSSLAPDTPLNGYIYEIIVDPDDSVNTIATNISNTINSVDGFSSIAVSDTINVTHPIGETKQTESLRGVESSDTTLINASVTQQGSSIVEVVGIQIYDEGGEAGAVAGYYSLGDSLDVMVDAINDYNFSFDNKHPFSATEDQNFKNITIDYGEYLLNKKDYSPSGSLVDRFVQTRFQSVEFSLNKDVEVEPDDVDNFVLTRDEHLSTFHRHSVSDKQKLLLSSTSNDFTNIITNATIDNTNALSYYQSILDNTYSDSSVKSYDKQVINVDNIYVPSSGKEYVDVTVSTAGSDVVGYTVNDTSLRDYLDNTYLPLEGGSTTIGQDFYKKEVINPNTSGDEATSENEVDYSVDTPLDLRYYNKLDLNPSTTGGLFVEGAGNPAATGSGALDGRYYTKALLDNGELDNRYYTETETDTKFLTKNGTAAQTLSGDITLTGNATFNNDITGNINTASKLLNPVDISITNIEESDGTTRTETSSFDGSTNISFDLSHSHNDTYYTKGQLDQGELDTRYYTESQIDDYLNDKDNYQNWSFSYGLPEVSTDIVSGHNIRFTGTNILVTAGNDGTNRSEINFKISNDIVDGVSSDLTNSGIITISRVDSGDQTFDLDDRYYTHTQVDDSVYEGWSLTVDGTTENFNERTGNSLTVSSSGSTTVDLLNGTLTIDSTDTKVSSLDFITGTGQLRLTDNESGEVDGPDLDGRYYTEGEIDGFFEPTVSGKKQIDWGNVSGKPISFTPSSHGNEAHSETYITTSDVTYDNLNTNGDVGNAAGQLAPGDHNHDSQYYTQTDLDPQAAADMNVLDIRYYTKDQLDPQAGAAGDNVLDGRYYTEQEADQNFQPKEDGFIYARLFTSGRPTSPISGDMHFSGLILEIYDGSDWIQFTGAPEQ